MPNRRPTSSNTWYKTPLPAYARTKFCHRSASVQNSAICLRPYRTPSSAYARVEIHCLPTRAFYEAGTDASYGDTR
eukprot:3760615-Rhodomonas_salina.2